jgi:heavy metal sensor kinase
VLLVGLAVLNTAVIAGIIATVYVRSRREAHEAFHEDLRFRAKTLAGILEIDKDGPEFEASTRTMPEYGAPGSGAYAVMYDAKGKATYPSPSLGKHELAAAAPWSENEFAFTELAEGPDAIPCGTVTYSFVARVEAGKAASSWTPPAPEDRRWQIVVAKDSRPRDAGLANLLGFLALIGAAALGVTAAGGILVARCVLDPIRRMTTEAAALTPGDPSRRLVPETIVLELASLSTTLNSALDRLGDALDRQRRFTSDASHELRTPLAVLLGNVELLLRRERTGRQYRDGLERQRRITLRMSEITENLLALARADDGRAHIRREPVAMPELVRGVCDEFADVAAGESVSLACAADESVEVVGDPTYIAALLQNLVANAVKFTPAGGSVEVALSRENGHALLDVKDTGPGIPAADRPRIFERFFRVNEGRDRREGAGLGLAIVDWIVRVHGGTIEVADRPGGGTVFRVRLPIDVVRAP